MSPKPVVDPRSAREHWVPRAAVAAVAVAALGAAVMVKRADTGQQEQRVAVARPAATSSAPAISAPPDRPREEPASVVEAPPLKPATQPAARALAAASPNTTSMGSAAPCAKCGVVQMVVAVHEHSHPKATGYQMHIRMDDGSVRTVQQRGAMAPGSRVQVEGSTVRALGPN